MAVSIIKTRNLIFILAAIFMFFIMGCTGQPGNSTEEVFSQSKNYKQDMSKESQGTIEVELLDSKQGETLEEPLGDVEEEMSKDLADEMLEDIPDKMLESFTEDVSAEIIEETEVGNNDFYIEEISDELFSRIYGLSYKENCTVPREELRFLHVLHKDLQGDSHEGELIVNVAIAEVVLEIFRQLYEADYPIEKIRLVDEYDADDERSMADNNSSAFNFRFISHTQTVSMHGKGLAVDINPLYNPYVKEVNGALSIEPANGVQYTDRNIDFDYKIDENDLAYKLFTAAGFTWGGNWKNSKDYQHFEIKPENIKNIYSKEN